jgi:hypothetical protein
MPNLDKALLYASKGLHVFPLNGKIPMISKERGGNGFKDGTTDVGQIKTWWAEYPDANIGIACGPSKLLVLDVDTKDNGLVSYEELLQFIPDIAKGWTVRTGSGGIHVYFRYDHSSGIPLKNSQSDLAPGLDTRGVDGYVAAPPSIHPDTGEPYKWVSHEGKLPSLPEAFFTRLNTMKSEKVMLSADLVGDKITDGRKRFLASAAGKFRRIGADEGTILVALQQLNLSRCAPPLDEKIVESTAHSIATNYKPAGSLLDVAAEKFNQPRRGRKKLNLVKYNTIKSEDIDWLWYGRIAYGKFTLAVGMPGKGKSYFTCALAAAVTTGTELPDDPFALRCTPHDVLLLTYEDGQGDTIRPRLERCGADLSRVHTLSHDETQFTIGDVDALEEALNEHPEIKVVVIDPVQSAMVGADGNNDESVRQSLQPLIRLAMRRGIAILGIKHLNKNEGASIENRIGGSIGYAGLARSILLVGHDNTKEFVPGHSYGGIIAIKTNVAAATMPIAYEITNAGFEWLGADPDLTIDSLLPGKPKKDRD